ncbi:MAG: RNA polymerase sigma factor [Planctomycetota bacterium]
MSSSFFRDLIASYQAGDSAAQGELLGQLETVLLTYLRPSMGRNLRSLEESRDICQQLLIQFHRELMSGKLAFENEAAMKGYLRSMVRNKLANRSDFWKAAKRGGGAVPASLDDESTQGPNIPTPADDLTASRVAEAKESRHRIQGQLTEEEEYIFDGRLLGLTNTEMARELGRTPDAVRMIWFRARERLARQGIVDKRAGA